MDQMQRIISKHQHTDGLIALFPQHQMSGNVSYDFGPNQGHGTLSNVASRYDSHSVSKGHYMNASKYDWKVSSYNDIYSVDLRDAFNGDAGAVFVFMKTDVAWGFGGTNYAIKLGADDDNFIEILKHADAGRMSFVYESDGETKNMNILGMATMGWFCGAIMWDRLVDDKVRVWLDGVDTTGAITLGTWAGDLAATLCVIGADENDGGNCWAGGLGITAIYNQVLSDEQMAWLSKP